MKKIFTILSAAALVALAASCDKLNEYPVFDDSKDAFVAFSAVSAKCAESDGELKIPVTLSSVAGLSTTISFEVVNGTAKEGTDFTISGSKTLSFDSENRTMNIVVKVIEHPGEFTGDLDFQLKISSGGEVSVGADDACKVTITDNDHPLAFILGDYNVAATKYNAGPIEYTMTVMKDPSDVSVVWFFNIFGNSAWADYDTIYYGVVNEEKTTITIPLGQESEYKYSNGYHIILYGLDSDLYGHDSGNLVVTIKEDGKVLDFGNEYGLWLYIPDAGGISTLLPGIVANKI